MRLIGLLLLLAVLIVGFRQFTFPVPATTMPTLVSAQPSLRSIIPPAEMPVPRDLAFAPASTSGRAVTGGACRSTGYGSLENTPVFSGNDLLQVDYTTAGQPSRTVLLPGGTWSRPSGVGGTFWGWAGCTFEQARDQVASAWGDPGLFVPVP